MGNADRVNQIEAMEVDIERYYLRIDQIVPTLLETDAAELAEARREIDEKHTCPSGAKEATYAKLAQGMMDTARQLLAQFEERYNFRWLPTLSAPREMAGGVPQWDVAADDAKAADERLSRMYADRDKWEGTAAESYWSQLPGQGTATSQLAASAETQGATLATGSIAHYKINVLLLGALIQVATELTGAQYLSAGNGLYMRRTAQAIASLEGLGIWMNEAERGAAAEAEHLNTGLRPHEAKLHDWDQLAKDPSQQSSPGGNRTDITMGSTQLDSYSAQVTSEGLHISVVG